MRRTRPLLPHYAFQSQFVIFKTARKPSNNTAVSRLVTMGLWYKRFLTNPLFNKMILRIHPGQHLPSLMILKPGEYPGGRPGTLVLQQPCCSTHMWGWRKRRSPANQRVFHKDTACYWKPCEVPVKTESISFTEPV